MGRSARFARRVVATASQANRVVTATKAGATGAVSVLAGWQFGIPWGVAALLASVLVVVVATGLRMEGQLDEVRRADTLAVHRTTIEFYLGESFRLAQRTGDDPQMVAFIEQLALAWSDMRNDLRDLGVDLRGQPFARPMTVPDILATERTQMGGILQAAISGLDRLSGR